MNKNNEVVNDSINENSYTSLRDREDAHESLNKHEKNNELSTIENNENQSSYLIPIEDSVIPEKIRENLSVEQIDKYYKELDDVNYDSLIQFGSDIQENLGNQSERVLRAVQNEDVSMSIKGKLDSLMKVFKYSDPSELLPENQSGLKGFFSRRKKDFESILNKLNDDAMRLTNLENDLRRGQRALNDDIKYMDELKSALINNYNDTFPLIAAAEKKRYEMSNQVLPDIKERMSGQEADLDLSNQYYDVEESINQLDKKIHSLQSSQLLSKQTYDQITMMQGMNKALSRNINNQIITVIPTWKTQFAQARTAQKQAALAQISDIVNEYTDEMLRKNAENMQDTALKIVANSEQSTISIDTLKEIHRGIEDTQKTIMEIKRMGTDQRINESKEMKELMESHKLLMEKADQFNKDQVEERKSLY